MNADKIIKELKKKYPNKSIVSIPQENPKEILCEINPTSLHPERSTALAIVGKSVPHYHKKSTEVYQVIKGILIVYKDGKRYVLKEKEKLTIEPNVIHHTEGDEAWFLTYSTPGWTFDDHILV